MTTKATDILHRVMDILMNDGKKNEADAVQAMIQWIAFEVGVDPGMVSGSIHQDAYQKLKTIDLSPLAEHREDVIGYFVTTYYKSHCASDFFADMDVCRRIASRTDQLPEKTIYRLLDRCAGSGGLLIALSERFGDKGILYAAEPDLTAYRIANINRTLFNINARIIHADYRIHDLSPGSRNWLNANAWNPTKWDNLAKAGVPNG